MRSSGFFSRNDGTKPEAAPDRRDREPVYVSPDGACMLWRDFVGERTVALKTLKKDLADDPVLRSRLRREYEIGRSLKHPGVCETLDWIDDCGQGPGIVLEWIEGETLEALLGRGGDGLPRRRIALELCEALSYLHRKQVIHKDLKPENIMIARLGGNVKLIDFGLADADAIPSGREPGGTWEYAAPEVIAGQEADILSDIYSLGKVLERISAEFAPVVAVCTASDRQRRYSSVEEVRDALAVIGREHKHKGLIPALAMAAVIALGIATWLLLPRPDPVRELFEEAVRMVEEAGGS